MHVGLVAFDVIVLDCEGCMPDALSDEALTQPTLSLLIRRMARESAALVSVACGACRMHSTALRRRLTWHTSAVLGPLPLAPALRPRSSIGAAGGA